MEIQVKECKKCGLEKSFEDFYRTPGGKHGLMAFCKLCDKERKKERYYLDPQKYQNRTKEWKKNNPDKWRKSYQKNKKKYRERYNSLQKEYALKRNYGITKEDRDRMLEAQGGICANPSCNNSAWCVDHCHTTGIVRGLLCNRCNRAAGLLEDNPELLQGLLDYLINFIERNPHDSG